jgi:hypothetical protein
MGLVRANRVLPHTLSRMSLHSALETLANYRATNARESQDIVKKGMLVLEKHGLSRLGDDGKHEFFD